MWNKKYLLVLLLITIIAILPRAAVVFNPYTYFFSSEQGIDYLVTKNIVIDHKLILTAHQGGFGGFFKAPGFNYLLAIPFVLFNGDPFGGRILMLVISVLTVTVAYVSTSRIFNLRSSIFISFLLAVSPGLKDHAGAISPPFVIPFLTVIYLYFLYKAFQKDYKYIYLLTFTVGLMAHFEMAAAGILTMLLILTGFVLLIRKAVPYRFFILSISTFTLAISPLIIFDIFNKFYNLNGILKMANAASSGLTNQSGSNLINRLGAFIWTYLSTFSPQLIISIFLLIIMIVGIFFTLKDKKTRRHKKIFVYYMLLIPLFTFAILFIYPGEFVHQWWITYLAVIYCFLLGIVLDHLWKNNLLKIVVMVVILLLSLGYLKRTFFIYRTQFSYPPSTYIKEDKAIKYIFNDAGRKPFGIIVYSGGTQENYDYLIWWNDKTKFHNSPYKEKKNLYYLIIEPKSYFLSIDEKKLNSLRSGILLKTEQLSNGFSIEKRLVK